MPFNPIFIINPKTTHKGIKNANWQAKNVIVMYFYLSNDLSAPSKYKISTIKNRLIKKKG